MTNSIPQRKDWIDALRAIAILFVIFGHQAPWCDVFFQYTTPIKIPMFFAISGYLFNERNGDQRQFFLNWLKKLVFPFFCLVTIPALFYSCINGITVITKAWEHMISGESYWFMTCFIIAEVIHFYIRKLCNSILGVSLSCVICSIVGFLLSYFGLLDYAKINTALICQFYLLIGYLIKNNEAALDRLDLPIRLILFGCYVVLCFTSTYLFDNVQFDCNMNQYYSIPYCMGLITLGCLSCFLIGKQIVIFPKWVTYIGQNTLVLYLWAGHAMLAFVLLKKNGVSFPDNNIWVSIFQTVWCTVACMLAAFYINKYIPVIVGKRNNR